MTAMEQIELISIEARKCGMTYGEYIKKFNPVMPEPEATRKVQSAKCKVQSEKRSRACARSRIRSSSTSGVPPSAQDDLGVRRESRGGGQRREFRTVVCVCEMCGGSFEARRRDAKYCEECRKKRALEAVKRWAARKALPR